MKDLQSCLDQLISFFPPPSQVPPAWSHVLIVEDTKVEHGKVSHIPRSALVPPEEYADRFNLHFQTGYAWINMNAAGILDDTLLVVIELPNYSKPTFAGKTSVNFSGPSSSRWAAGHIEIIE